ncbi:hypothetical protein PDESU_04272 [Pontiella desulfatans]|uniref:Uncharacterized protein n=1 Tax=Pontiella desulfatans TaxID=2750659 RepID=A0A6C2U7B3_PONDE|nr:hypothetical protein [Pontiella desulfatans]VGO15687.1 hypothetical protein PDESU_04272 [Pontiella desulfatans]
MQTSEWIRSRRLLWDDDEYILIASSVKKIRPMKQAGKVTVQPKAQYCCGNSFRAGSTKRTDNIRRLHTWVIEHDEKMTLQHQRDLWKYETMPHTLRVFSGNKSIHVYIRTVEDVDAETWKRVAKDLLLIFPFADKGVLGGKSTFSRLPWGVRIEGDQSIDQTVEATYSRIPLQTLLDWIAEQDVIKDRECDIDIEESRLSADQSCPKTRKELGEKFPDQMRLYKKLIEHRVIAEQGRRNRELIKLMSFAFDSVSEEVALFFAESFYRLHAHVFENTLEEHMQNAIDHQRNMLASYPAKLSPQERGIYENMDSRRKTFFRICRSFSKCETTPGRSFFLPMTKTGHRMKLETEQINRLVKEFISKQIIRQTEAGTRHQYTSIRGLKKGKAATYEWVI